MATTDRRSPVASGPRQGAAPAGHRSTPLRRALRRLPVTGVLGLLVEGSLRDEGWLRSFRESRSVDRSGAPLPWYTYAAIHLLESRLSPSLRVFEFGAGLSTVWYAARVAEVVAVEHDERWAAFVGGQLPPNGSVLLRPGEDAYVAAVAGDDRFDVVAVDGLARARAAVAAVPFLTAGGVIVWDNADWPDFARTRPELEEQGFRSLVLRGMGPINRQGWETAVLYRDGNCLGI